MKKPMQLLLIAALTLSLALNGMVVLAQDKTAPETSSAVTVETKDGETEKKPDAKETEQQESGQKGTSSQQTTSETASSSQAAESSQPQESSKAEESSQTTVNSGSYGNALWELNPKTKTLTLTLNAEKGYNILINSYDEFPWYGREKEFSKLVLNGNLGFMGTSRTYFLENVKSVESIIDSTHKYVYDVKTNTLTLIGTGSWNAAFGTQWPAKKLIIGDDITEITCTYYGYQYAEVGAKVKIDTEFFRDIQNYITIDSQNPYYSSYEGCLYSKDFTTLYAVPQNITSPKFHPALTTLTYDCMCPSNGTTMIIPWGVTTLESLCFSGTNCTYILPDTISNVPDRFFESKTSVRTFIVSKNNRAGIKAQTNIGSEQNPVTVKVVDSVAKYYPGKVGPEGGETSTVPGPSGEPESSQPSPGPSGGTSQPTTSKPATSQPSTSKPATSQPSTSKPATSQPTSKPATSQPAPSQPVNQPESSVPIESSQPAASTQPEDKLSEGSGESLELSIEPSSEADESTIAPVENKTTGGWVVPVVVLVIAAAVAAGVVVLRMRKR